MTNPRVSLPSRRAVIALTAGLALAAALPEIAAAATASELSRSSEAALQKLYSQSPQARRLGAKARAILIFPKIAKAGFIFGAQGGEGAARVRGRYVGYYSIVAGSFGLQAGVQTFSYAMFLMTPRAVDRLKEAEGWAIGSDPNVVIADAGAAATLDTTTLKKDVYAMPFGQAGLMAGITLQGSKITAIHPKP